MRDQCRPTARTRLSRRSSSSGVHGLRQMVGSSTSCQRLEHSKRGTQQRGLKSEKQASHLLTPSKYSRSLLRVRTSLATCIHCGPFLAMACRKRSSSSSVQAPLLDVARSLMHTQRFLASLLLRLGGSAEATRCQSMQPGVSADGSKRDAGRVSAHLNRDAL